MYVSLCEKKTKQKKNIAATLAFSYGIFIVSSELAEAADAAMPCSVELIC